MGRVRSDDSPAAAGCASSPPRRARCAVAARVAACVFVAMRPVHADAAEWNGYLSLASDYIYRGVSLVESGPNVQAGIEGRFDDRFVAGAWATNVDRQYFYQAGGSGQVDFNAYGGVDVGCGDRCRARVIVTRYTYTGPYAHDWNEATASVAFADRVGAALSWSPRGFGSDRATRTIEAWATQPLSRAASIAASGGYIRIGSYGYWYARAGASYRLGRFVFDISRYWSDPKYVEFGFDDRNRRYVASVSTAF